MDNLKMMIIFVIIIMILFLCFFIYNLIKCYLPRLLNNRDENSKYINQKNESKNTNETKKIEFEEL